MSMVFQTDLLKTKTFGATRCCSMCLVSKAHVVPLSRWGPWRFKVSKVGLKIVQGLYRFNMFRSGIALRSCKCWSIGDLWASEFGTPRPFFSPFASEGWKPLPFFALRSKNRKKHKSCQQQPRQDFEGESFLAKGREVCNNKDIVHTRRWGINSRAPL